MPAPAPSSCASSTSRGRARSRGALLWSGHRRRGLAARGAPALRLLEQALAQADRGGRDLDQLVVRDELDRILERQLDGRGEEDRIVLAGGADVGELLGPDGVDHQVVLATVDPDDHALVDLLAGGDEQAAALLQVEQRVGDRLAVLVAHQHAVVAALDLARDSRKALEDVAHESVAAGERQELPLEADEPPCRNAVLEARTAVADTHVGELAAARADRLHHRSLVLLLDVHRERLVGLVYPAVPDPGQHLRTRHGELVALAAHVLDENGQVQLAAARDLERSEEHTSELQSPVHLVCRLLLEKKKAEKNDTRTFVDDHKTELM